MEIDPSQLEYAYKLLDKDEEVCGQIIDSQLVIQNIGNTTHGQHYCQNPVYKGAVWHTHPHTAKGYPSISDLLKPIKHSALKISIIFTPWGIWELSSRKKYILSDSKENEEFNQYFKRKLAPYEHALYFSSDRGRKESVNKYIHDVKKILEKYEYSIFFTPWKNL